MRCPLCNARHVGSILTLYIDSDKERDDDHKDSAVGAGKNATSGLPKAAMSPKCSLPLYLGKALTARCKRLEDDVAALHTANDKCIAWMQKNKLATLPDSYTAY
ncbi:hypothetical protein GGH95_003218, partial [Coemansia sp. RSA 1836]